MIVGIVDAYRLFFETQGKKYGRNFKLIIEEEFTEV